MAKIFAPNKQYNGMSASVPLVNGQGETDDPQLIVWFRKHGYEVEEVETDHADPGSDLDLDKPLEEMKLDELKTYAKLKEIELNGLTKKDDILQAIVEEQERRDGGGAGHVE
ncbi:Rho termination factor N-terminal domain-containing protein [Paenibacillus cisolokensis]|uniref:Rho termination factor N-terminal domain-containing protein n=1 Tax=Paenibacillus cisolokensis TaxID=1658519 RepID=UPI003D2CF9BF